MERPRPGDFVSRRNANSPRNNDILTGISMGLINTSGNRRSRRRDTETRKRKKERRREKEKLLCRRYRTPGRVALTKLINLRFSASINYWHAFVIQTSAIIRSAATPAIQGNTRPREFDSMAFLRLRFFNRSLKSWIGKPEPVVSGYRD